MNTKVKIALTVGSIVLLLGISFLSYKIIKKKGENKNEGDDEKKLLKQDDNNDDSNTNNSSGSNTSNGSYGKCSTSSNNSSLTIPYTSKGIKAFQDYANKNGSSLTADGKWGKCSQTEWNRLEGILLKLLSQTGLSATQWNTVGYKTADKYL